MAQDDRVAVQIAGVPAVHRVLAAHVEATGVDGQLVGHVGVGDVGLDAVVEAAGHPRVGVVVKRAVALGLRLRVAEVLRLQDHEVAVDELRRRHVKVRGSSLGLRGHVAVADLG